jgi:thermitase
MRRMIVLVAAVAALFAACAGPAAAASFQAGQVIVKYADGVSTGQRVGLFHRTGVARTIGPVRGVDAHVVRVTGDPTAVAARLNRSALVQYAEPNYTLHTLAVPNDPDFNQLYGLAKLHAPEGWDAAGMGGFPASGGVKIGIVDTGIDQTHPDLSGQTVGCAQSRGLLGVLAGQIQVGSCTDDNDHGTHVSGTIAAKANNGVGVAGVDFNAGLVMCRALGGPLGSGSTADVANCINWVSSQGVKVISMSLGGGDSTTLHNAVSNAWKNGTAAGAVVVAAAGNDGDSTVEYPAGYPEAVSVGATDANDAHASFSNTNSDVEVSAPGVDILSTVRGGGYAKLSGTSMATPHASAVAGVLWKLCPSDTAAAIRSRLDAAVDDLGAAGRDTSFGFGRVNLLKAASQGC